MGSRRKTTKMQQDEELRSSSSCCFNSQIALDVVSGGGEMGSLLRVFDWSKTELGPLASWPQSLLTAVSIVLATKFPMILFWGPKLNVIYNDAYVPIFGMKHPEIFGKTGFEAWAEVWDVIHPMMLKVIESGDATWSDDQLLILSRNKYLEETYFTWSYSPIRDEMGKVAGVLTPITETTKRVLSERRLKVLRELGNRTSRCQNDIEACMTSVETFLYHPDLPFTMIYLASSPEHKTWDMMCHSGLSAQQVNSFPVRVKAPRITQRNERRSWDNESNNFLFRVFSEVALKRGQVEVKYPSNYFGFLPGGYWPESPSVGSAIPIFSDQNTIAGILFVGINPRRPLDDDYKGFLELLAGQMGRSLSSARAYEAEKKRAEALAEIDNAKTVFFSNVSHEFRTPLTLIMGPLEDMLSDQANPLPLSHKERGVLIQRNALRLQKLVNCLLDYSRIEAGRTKGSFELVDLPNLSADLASMFRSAFQKARIAYQVHCPPLSQRVYVDISMWEKIILNLLSNAFKYTLSGSVNVMMKESDGCAVLVVSDTGTGIPESDLPHIFERFHRVEGAKGRSHEGTGIGLALLQELVKLHYGKVVVRSEVGVGSTFEVSVPFGKAHLPQDQIALESSQFQGTRSGAAYIEEVLRWLPTRSPGSSSSGDDALSYLQYSGCQMETKSRILLADDNSDMREYVSGLLKELWDVETVCNGEEALQAARKKKPDLILSDVMMPVMDGFRLLDVLKSDPTLNAIPVILLSARAGEEAKVEGLRAGADDYLVKPFSAKELVARIHTHLEIGRMRGELEKKVKERTEELQKMNANLELQIEQRRGIERALAASEEHYRNLTSISPVGIFHTDAQGHPIYVNPSWTRMTGILHSQLQEKKWYEQIVHPQDMNTVSALFLKAQNSGLPFTAEFRLSFEAGDKEVWVLGQLISERAKFGEVIGYIGTITDLTEQKQLEKERLSAAEELAQQKTRAEEAEYYRKQQEQFIDMVCHEIRNPLTGVDGNAELMKDTLQVITNVIQNEYEATVSPSNESAFKPDTLLDRHRYSNTMGLLHKEVAKLVESVDAISECVEHQKLIVNDVLDLSKLEANKIELHIEPFSAIDTLTSVKKMFETQASKKHISLEVCVPQDDVIIKGDYARVAQILINLVSNAVKFTHTGGIEMGLQVKEQSPTHTTIQFAVKDTGVGLSVEERNRLFQRFAQASRSTFAEYGGSGLGLFISKNLARLMDGDIFVESEKWKGAKFMAVVKCENPTDKEILKVLMTKHSIQRTHVKSPEHPIGRETPTTPTTILIVEDNRINQQLLSKYFQQTNYLHVIASNGLEAVQVFERSLKELNSHIDLILMDIEMPVMNGYDAAAAIRKLEGKSHFHIPIIGLSGNARCSQIQKALAVGMDDYITKPFKKEEIFRKIRSHLEPDIPFTSNVECAATSPIPSSRYLPPTTTTSTTTTTTWKAASTPVSSSKDVDEDSRGSKRKKLN